MSNPEIRQNMGEVCQHNVSNIIASHRQDHCDISIRDFKASLDQFLIQVEKATVSPDAPSEIASFCQELLRQGRGVSTSLDVLQQKKASEGFRNAASPHLRSRNRKQHRDFNNTPIVDGRPKDRLSNAPDELRELFDKIGDQRNVTFNISELDEQHGEEDARRQRQLDKGMEMDLTDEEFEAQHLRRRASLEKEYNELTDTIVRLKQVCTNRGLDINPAHYATGSDSEEENNADSEDDINEGNSYIMENKGPAIQAWVQDVRSPDTASIASDQAE